jgi:hypothetical protein
MAQQDTKRGPDTTNVGREQRGMVGTADQRINAENRSPDEMKYEVAQRGSQTDAHGNGARESKPETGTQKKQTSGYGNREDRENPAAGLQQSGEKQSHELPGEGTRVGDGESKKTQAMSQNGAAIRPGVDRPSR